MNQMNGFDPFTLAWMIVVGVVNTITMLFWQLPWWGKILVVIGVLMPAEQKRRTYNRRSRYAYRH